MTKETRQQRSTGEQREDIEGRTAKALAHSIRVRIMEILSENDGSPVDVSRKMGTQVHPSLVAYHFNVLEELGCIEEVEAVPVRGAVKHIYRSLRPTMFADYTWAALSPQLRSDISGTVLTNTFRRLGDALSADTFDKHEDRHLSIQTISVDWGGWDELRELMARTLDEVEAIDRRSTERTEEEADRFPATATLISYESPRMYESR